MDDLIAFPPALQLLCLGVLAAYVSVSLLARWRYPWLWSHADSSSWGHFVEYTLVPSLVLIGAVVAVWSNWNPDAPLDGGWRLIDLVLGPGAILLAVGLVVAGNVVARRERRIAGMVTSSRPLGLIAAGIVALFAGVFLLLNALEKAGVLERART